MNDEYKPGLEGVVAARTRLSRVDGQAGTLVLAGYPVEELAPRASFEEVVYLMWNGRLPSAAELSQLGGELAALRDLPAATLALLRAAAAGDTPVMDALRMATASSSLATSSSGSTVIDARRLVALLPSIVASYERLRQDLEPVAADPELGHVANFLYMLDGERPAPRRVRALETYLNTVVDHGMNASTFAARVVLSTRSDMVSAVVAAIGALKGPLHGGAPGPALDMVFEIGRPERAEAYLRAKLERGERLMGFGHRVYKVRDPRAEVLRQAAKIFYADGDKRQLYELAGHVEDVAVRMLSEHKPGRRLETNVEYYTALLLHGIGLGSELFTPVFATGRVAGWTAHCLEQEAEGRLLRPRADYVGEMGRRWSELEVRA